MYVRARVCVRVCAGTQTLARAGLRARARTAARILYQTDIAYSFSAALARARACARTAAYSVALLLENSRAARRITTMPANRSQFASPLESKTPARARLRSRARARTGPHRSSQDVDFGWYIIYIIL